MSCSRGMYDRRAGQGCRPALLGRRRRSVVVSLCPGGEFLEHPEALPVDGAVDCREHDDSGARGPVQSDPAAESSGAAVVPGDAAAVVLEGDPGGADAHPWGELCGGIERRDAGRRPVEKRTEKAACPTPHVPGGGRKGIWYSPRLPRFQCLG